MKFTGLIDIDIDAVKAVGGSVSGREATIPDEQVASRKSIKRWASQGGRHWDNHDLIELKSGSKLLFKNTEVGNCLKVAK